VYPRVSIIS